MQIHVVAAGETLWSIARQYGQDPAFTARFNGLTAPYALAVGQALLILEVTGTLQVAAGDTLFGISQQTGLTARRLWQLNPQLEGREVLYPGEVLVTALADTPTRSVQVSGYAYPFVSPAVLRGILPYAGNLIPFTYGIAQDGSLVELQDQTLLRLAQAYQVRPLMHLSTLTETDTFSSKRAELVFQDAELQNRLIQAVLDQIVRRGYQGLDVDFEFIQPEFAQDYAAFVARLRQAVNALGYPVVVALAPKTSANQAGILYQGHSYPELAEAADAVLLMTYEWGYTYGPPMAVAPVPSVRRVLDYAVSEIPPQKIFMGFPNYGYDWTLPYTSGLTAAQSISNEYALQLALRYGAEIRFDEAAQSPWFTYADPQGQTHEVWFEDARSVRAKLALIEEYGFLGVGFWNFMRPFPQGWMVLQSMYQIAED